MIRYVLSDRHENSRGTRASLFSKLLRESPNKDLTIRAVSFVRPHLLEVRAISQYRMRSTDLSQLLTRTVTCYFRSRVRIYCKRYEIKFALIITSSEYRVRCLIRAKCRVDVHSRRKVLYINLLPTR